jgi:hypothetical protein
MGLNIGSDGPTGRPATFAPPKVKQTAALPGGRFRDLPRYGGIAAYGFDLLASQGPTAKLQPLAAGNGRANVPTKCGIKENMQQFE